MKKLSLTIALSFLVTICLIYTTEYLYSHTECSPWDYLCCGSVTLFGQADPPYVHCVYLTEVLHYTDALVEDEEIYVHGQNINDINDYFMQMMGYKNEAALCSVYAKFVLLEPGQTYNIWFTCEHSGDNGRDPDSGYYVVEVPLDCGE